MIQRCWLGLRQDPLLVWLSFMTVVREDQHPNLATKIIYICNHTCLSKLQDLIICITHIITLMEGIF